MFYARIACWLYGRFYRDFKLLVFWRKKKMKKFVNVVMMVVVMVFSNIASADLIAHWTFDNDFTDVSANSFDLTNSGASIVSGGKIGAAASFSGSSQYASVTFATNAMFDPSEDYTVMAWYNLNISDIAAGTSSAGVRYQVFESGSNYTASYALRDLDSDSLGDIGQVYTQNATGAASNMTFSTGANQTWHHIAITYNHLTGVVNAYLDGSLANTMTRSGTLKDSTSFYVGTFRSHNGRYWNGLIDDVAVFDNIVSTTDIQYYAQGNAIPEPATVALLALGSLLFAGRRKG
jgi:hypothetical protein